MLPIRGQGRIFPWRVRRVALARLVVRSFSPAAEAQSQIHNTVDIFDAQTGAADEGEALEGTTQHRSRVGG